MFWRKKNKNATKVLVTGFGPFGENKANPSGELVQKLTEQFNSKADKDIDVRALTLRTQFNSCYKLLKKEINAYKPDIIISFGLRANAKGFDIETTAQNFVTDPADITGEEKKAGKIYANGAANYSSTLPCDGMVKALLAANIPAKTSSDAGQFVCNFLFYSLMHEIHLGMVNASGGFVHIPYSDELKPDHGAGLVTMPESELIKGAEIIIRYAVKAHHKPMA